MARAHTKKYTRCSPAVPPDTGACTTSHALNQAAAHNSSHTKNCSSVLPTHGRRSSPRCFTTFLSLDHAASPPPFPFVVCEVTCTCVVVYTVYVVYTCCCLPASSPLRLQSAHVHTRFNQSNLKIQYFSAPSTSTSTSTSALARIHPPFHQGSHSPRIICQHLSTFVNKQLA